jgi:hypothetical protein
MSGALYLQIIYFILEPLEHFDSFLHQRLHPLGEKIQRIGMAEEMAER